MSGGYEPVVVAWFMDLNRFFATAEVSGQAVETRIVQLTRGGIGAIRTQLSEKLEIPRLSGADLTLLTTDAHANIFEPRRLLNTRVQLLLGFAGLPYSDYLPMFTGVVDRYALDYTTLRLSLTDSSVRTNVTAAVPVGPPYFVGAPSGSTSTRVPLILGTVTDAPTIELTAEATATLALDLGASETVCYLREFGAPFPSTGRVSIDTEGAVAYAARRVVNLGGFTYLELSGLVRTQATSHASDAPVTLQVTSYQYLLGYQVGTLLAVRAGGVLVSPQEYQLVTQQADRPVSVLQFATKRGQVTVDVTSESVDTTNHLTNGGFETGDGTAWTTSGATLLVGTGQPAGGELVTNGGFETGDGTGWTASGATLTVAGSAPFPLAGSYRAALEGGLGTDGDLYQDLTTVVGTVYRWQFGFLNARAITSTLVLNGGFETGDLTDWTALPGTGSATTATVVSGGAPEGSDSFQVNAAGSDPFGLNYGYVLQQTLTTVIGENYTLTLWQQTSVFTASSTITEPGVATSGTVSGGTTALSPDTGLTGGLFKPTASLLTLSGLRIRCVEAGAPTVRNLDIIPAQGNGWRQVQVTFTASSTSTLLSLEMSGSRTSTTLPFVPVRLDAVVVVLTGGDASQTSYALGTPGLPTLYAHDTLAIADNWTVASGTFVATTTSTRLTLKSQSSVVPLASYFDTVSVQPTVTYDVLPWEGLYRGALTGGAASYGDVRQDVTTTVGEHYTLQFVYRDALDHLPNVLINGSFETGDLAAWSIASNTRTAIGNTHARSTTDLIADGQYALQLTADGSSPGDPTYEVSFYQDVPVTPATPYTVTLWYLSQVEYLATGTVYSTASYRIGTPGDPSAYVALTTLPPTTLVQNTVTSGPQKITQASVVVTPTSGTLRLTLRGACESPATLPSLVYFDAVSIIPSSPASDLAAYQVGTPADPALYASAALAQSFSWRQVRRVFKATSTTTRITLRSQYPADAQPSYFDALSVTLGGGGLNPTEAIRRVIATYQPTASVNAQSFLEAQVQLADWEFSGISLAVSDAMTLLQRMAQQCGSLLLKDAEDQYSLIVLNDDRPIVAEFTTANIITPTMGRESSPQDAIYTEYYVYFGVRSGGNSSGSDFSSVTYATPFETSAPGGAALLTRCRVARAVFGKDARREEYCEWIQDFTTANLYLAWLVNRYTTSPDLLTFSTWLDALPVTVGRMIAVKHPLLQYGGARALAEVIGWQFQPQQMQVALQARLLPYAQNILDVTLDDISVAIEMGVPADTLAIFDLSSLDPDLAGFAGAVADGTYLYLAPHASTFATWPGKLVRHATTGALSDPGAYAVKDLATVVPGGEYGCNAGCFDGRYAYFCPVNDGLNGPSGVFVRYDTTLPFSADASYEVIDLTGTTGVHVYSMAVWDTARYVYFMPTDPSGGLMLVRYDTTDDFSDSASWTTFDLLSVSGMDVSEIVYTGIYADGQIIMSCLSGKLVSYAPSDSFTAAGSYTVTDVTTFAAFDGVGGASSPAYGAVGMDDLHIYWAYGQEVSVNGLNQLLRYTRGADITDEASFSFALVEEHDDTANGIFPDHGLTFPDIPWWFFYGYRGHMAYDGAHLILAPFNAWDDFSAEGLVMLYDTLASFTASASWSFVNLSQSDARLQFFHGAYYQSGHRYLVPGNSGAPRADATEGQSLFVSLPAPTGTDSHTPLSLFG